MKTRLFHSVLLPLLLFATSLFAQPLEGPQVVPVTKLVVLKAPEAKLILWESNLVLDSIERDNEYIFVSPKTKGTITIKCITIDIKDGDLDVHRFTHNILVVDGIDPVPDPNPNPDPDPTFTEFQKAVNLATYSLPPVEKLVVAKCYSNIAKAIENGKLSVLPPGTKVITDPVKAFAEFKSCSQTSLGARWEVWRPSFDKITEAANKTGMQTIFDVAKLMRQAEAVLSR